jgi:RNA polymerase sigma-70 factor (ECF subfamily)
MRARESIPVDPATGSVTSVTLLMRLQQTPADQAAWAEFAERYGRRIHAWCRRWGLQEADTQDVAQTVMLKVLGAVQAFRYDPNQKFRAWLKTITHHAWQDLVRGRREVGAGMDTVSVADPLLTLEARDDLGTRLAAAYEEELVEQALARVRPRVQPPTWEAFRLTAVEGLSGSEAASRLGMAVTSVYKAKSNVQKLLEAEVRYLEGGET